MKIQVKIITNCPSCEGFLERIKDQLFCRNPDCSATQGQKVQHFAKVMKIKGLGEKTIEKLGIEDIPDIYNLHIDTLTEVMGYKIGTKLATEIELSKTVTLEKLLPAFSIPLIGATAARKIYVIRSRLDHITLNICKEAGLGDKASSNLVNWLIDNRDMYINLPFTFIDKAKTSTSLNTKVCITGKLNDYATKALASKYLEDKGITVVPSVTKTLNLSLIHI